MADKEPEVVIDPDTTVISLSTLSVIIGLALAVIGAGMRWLFKHERRLSDVEIKCASTVDHDERLIKLEAAVRELGRSLDRNREQGAAADNTLYMRIDRLDDKLDEVLRCLPRAGGNTQQY